MKNPSIWNTSGKMVVWKGEGDNWTADFMTEDQYVDLGWFPSHAQALRAAIEWAEAQ